MRISAAAMGEPLPLENPQPQTVWFAARSCVVIREDHRDVIVGGTLIGSFGAKEIAKRNLMAVGVSQDPDVHLGELARGLGLTYATLRLLRRLHAEKGVEALVRRKHGGSESGINAATRRRVERLFDGGASVTKAFLAVRRQVPSRSTIGLLRKEWVCPRH